MRLNGIANLALVGAATVVVPLGVVIIVIRLLFEFLSPLMGPYLTWLVTEQMGMDGPVGKVFLVLFSTILLAAICVVAGIGVHYRLFRGLSGKIRRLLLAVIPGFSFIDSIITSLSTAEDLQESLIPVMVRFDDCSKLAFKVEDHGDDMVLLYIPSSPSPWSGEIAFVEASRVQVLDIKIQKVVALISTLGRGSNGVLSAATDLSGKTKGS